MSDTTRKDSQIQTLRGKLISPNWDGASVPINWDEQHHERVADYIGIFKGLFSEMKKPERKALVDQMLRLDPTRLDELSLEEIDRYVLACPQALLYLQEHLNAIDGRIFEIETVKEDFIDQKAALLDKAMFGSSQVTEKMRVAKVRELFPEGCNMILGELRKWERTRIRFNGQIKHLERLNDNLKKIQESIRLRVRKVPAGE